MAAPGDPVASSRSLARRGRGAGGAEPDDPRVVEGGDAGEAGRDEPPAPNLFLVVLGGRLPAAHIELHDVRFVLGRTIDDTLPALRRQWFGARRGLHLDSWMQVRWVDGHRVELRAEPYGGEQRLWFVNLGGYDPGQLAEQHAFALVVARSPQAAKAAALRRGLPGLQQRHKDDLHGLAAVLEAAGGEASGGDGAVDDCVDVQLSLVASAEAAGDFASEPGALAGSVVSQAMAGDRHGGLQRRWAVHLIPDGGQQPQVPDWFGYRPI